MPADLRRALQSLAAGAVALPERWRSGVAYNPLSARAIQDPYPTYARLRARSPVHRSRLLEAWVFTCYADVEAILRDYRRFSNMPSNRRAPRRRRIYVPPRADWTMLFLDPPEHTRLRALVNQAFTPRVVDALEPHIRAIMGELLDDIDDSAGFDLMAAVANPLPVIVIAEMLGVPPKDRDRFKHWSNARARMLEPTITAQERARAVAAGESLDAYFMPIIQARRREPRDDIISALAQAEEEGDKLTEREVLLMLRLLLVAGNETTRNLIGNGMLALLRNPDQMQRLRDNPDLLDSAIDEFLRYDSPVQLDTRVSQEDFQIGGKRIHRGQRVICLLGAANRDPSAFVQPDMLDIGRLEKSHISFGRGIHHCLGAPLALLEGRIAFSSLVERFSSIRLAAEPNQRSQMALRGVQELWVEVEHAPRCETSAARPLCFRPTPP
jgi:cytochrome P450